MAFDFLPNQNNNNQTQQTTPSGAGNDAGGIFNGSKTNVFFDFYNSHLDAHNLFSTPPLRNEFNLEYNFNHTKDIFSESVLNSKINSDWYGKNTDYNQLINGYTKFQNPTLLASTLKKINANITEDLFSNFKKPKININDRFGMFSFDLASMAMRYVYDYFTKQGKKVDANFVVKKGAKFFDTKTKKEVYQKVRKRKNGKPHVVSSVKKCLIDFEKKDSKSRSVEIFINNSFASQIRANEIIYNSMAAISLAKNLILKGFKVKITALLAVLNNRTDKNYFHFIPVKNFNENLDINAAAYVCGDARFFRYQGFKIFISGYDKVNDEMQIGIGSPLRDNNKIAKIIETQYVPNSNKIQADTRLYFGGSLSLTDAKTEVTNALKILNQKYGQDEKN